MRSRFVVLAMLSAFVAGCDERKGSNAAAAPEQGVATGDAPAEPAPAAEGGGRGPDNGFIVCPGDARCPR